MAPHPNFDGTQRLFHIGLKPLDVNEWIDTDAHLTQMLDEKARLAATFPDEVFAAEPGTEAAQAELLALLVNHLTKRFPDIYRLESNSIVMPDRTIDLTGPRPLAISAQLVAEDLILMRKGESGWRLAAGSLSFPSSWRLKEKFGQPIHAIHAPVPGFNAGTRNAELIARMFNNMLPSTNMVRWNWSLYPEADLYHPASGEGPLRFGEGPGSVFLRVERQTLRRLRTSGDILFTIRIYVDPLEQLERHENGPNIARGLLAQLLDLNPDQLAYKGLTEAKRKLAYRLDDIMARG